MKVDKTLNLKISIEESLFLREDVKGLQISSSKRFQPFTEKLDKFDNVSEKILSKKKVLDIIKEINKKLNFLNKGLKIEIDEELKIPVFKIIDLETNEVLRQIPWEEVLKLRKFFKNLGEEELKNKEFLKGLLFKKEV